MNSVWILERRSVDGGGCVLGVFSLPDIAAAIAAFESEVSAQWSAAERPEIVPLGDDDGCSADDRCDSVTLQRYKVSSSTDTQPEPANEVSH